MVEALHRPVRPQEPIGGARAVALLPEMLAGLAHRTPSSPCDNLGSTWAPAVRPVLAPVGAVGPGGGGGVRSAVDSALSALATVGVVTAVLPA